jgi:type II secretory pathway pseudopilin PulG
MGLAAAVVANLLVIGWVGGFLLLDERSPETFYQAVQEDEWLEWGTFWAFIVAGALFLRAAWVQRSTGVSVPWFLAGLGLFCLLVAMEEISWGQRVFGYRPPTYFLEHNFQQELNLHNVIGTGVRKDSLRLILLGYGVAFPLLARIPLVRRLLARFAMEAPPIGLTPAFLATFLTYQSYPFDFAGEVVEFMMGLAFAFAALASAYGLAWARPRLPMALAACTIAVLVLGIANAAVSRRERASSPAAMQNARTELEALRQDFLEEAAFWGGRLPTKCGLHKRLYSFMEKYDETFLIEGRFAALQSQGLPEERAAFLVDPWNTAYWVRDSCKGDRVVFVYSFGPNRRRESTEREIRGDDVGVILKTGRDPEVRRRMR